MGEIYDLGASATSFDLSSLGLQILRNYNMLTYPVQPSRDVYSQFASAKNDTMLVILDFKTNGPDPMNSVPEVRHDVGIANIISNESLVVYVTGAPAFNYDIQTQTVTDIERIDPITITLILVIVGVFFASLAFASFGLLRSVGIAVMLGISIALLVALTLVPAALSLFGDRIFWPRGLGLWRKRKLVGASYYARAAQFTAKHSKLVLLLALAISLPAASTVLSSQTSHDLIGQIPSSLESKNGYNIMSQGFGAGTVTPTYTIVWTPVMLVSGGWINVTALKAISLAENSTYTIPGVSKVYGLTHPSGNPIPFANFGQLNAAEQQAMIRSMKPFLGSDGKSAMVWAAFDSEPYSDQAIATVAQIRANVNVLKSQAPLLASSTMLVGGATASVSDLATSSGSDYFNLTALVLVGVFIVLLVALGSVFTPIRLIFTILLSISWAMAATIYFFKTYFSVELIWILPIMLLVIMVGLGLDYDIFLVTRIREYVAGGAKDEEAIETAVERTGGIITVTGLVTAGAYGTMMLSQIPMLQQLGLAIFIVVLLDATLTRIYLVPSIMMMMKRLNWWAPGRLRRVPVRPEEKLIPPIPLKTKFGVIVETSAIIGLLAALYLDYSNNAYLQNYVGRTTSAILSGINVWTGAILGVTSFLATYFLLQDRSKPRSAGGAANRFRQWSGKLRIRPRRIAKIAPTVSGILPGLPSMEQIPVSPAQGAGTLAEASGRTAGPDRKQEH